MHTWTKYLAALSIGCITPAALILANTPIVESDQLLQVGKAMKRHLAAHNFQQALPLAEKVVALVQGQKPHQPTHLVASLHNLAIIQERVGQLSDAQENLSKSISITVDVEGEYAPSLVKPLRYLGKLHYLNHNYAESLAVLRRAQHITHRNDGVYSLDQLVIVDWITSNHLKTNAFAAADVQQHFSYRINEVNFGADDPRMIAAMTKLGNWFRHTGQLADALKIYRKSLRLLEQQGADSDLQLIEPLRAISSTLYLQGDCCPDEPLDRVVNILENHPDSDEQDRLDALLHLADMSLLKKNGSRARQLYQKVWLMMGSDKIGKTSEEFFSKPTRLGVSQTDDVVSAFRKAKKGYSRGKPDVIYLAPAKHTTVVDVDDEGKGHRGLIGSPLPLCYPQLLDLAKVTGKEQLANYYVDFDFTVNEDGQVVEVAVVDSNTPPKLGRYVKNMLQETRFRPRFSEGQPVPSKHMGMHQTFTIGQGMKTASYSRLADSNAAVFQACQILASSS